VAFLLFVNCYCEMLEGEELYHSREFFERFVPYFKGIGFDREIGGLRLFDKLNNFDDDVGDCTEDDEDKVGYPFLRLRDLMVVNYDAVRKIRDAERQVIIVEGKMRDTAKGPLDLDGASGAGGAAGGVSGAGGVSEAGAAHAAIPHTSALGSSKDPNSKDHRGFLDEIMKLKRVIRRGREQLSMIPFVNSVRLCRPVVALSVTTHHLLQTFLAQSLSYPKLSFLLWSRIEVVVEKRHPKPEIEKWKIGGEYLEDEEKKEKTTMTVLRRNRMGEEYFAKIEIDNSKNEKEENITSQYTTPPTIAWGAPFTGLATQPLSSQGNLNVLDAITKNIREDNNAQNLVDFPDYPNLRDGYNHYGYVNGFWKVAQQVLQEEQRGGMNDHHSVLKNVDVSRVAHGEEAHGQPTTPFMPNIALCTVTTTTTTSGSASASASASANKGKNKRKGDGLLRIRGGSPTDTTFSGDGRLVAVACEDGSIKVWNQSMVRNSVSANNDVSNDGNNKATPHLKDLGCPQTLFGHRSCLPVFALSFCPSSRFLLSAGGDGTVRLWNARNGKALACYDANSVTQASALGRLGEYPVYAVEWAPSGFYFLTGGGDCVGRIWCSDGENPSRYLVGHLDVINDVCWHPNNNYVFTGSDDDSVRMWEVKTGDCVRVFQGCRGGVHKVVCCPNGRLLAVADNNVGRVNATANIRLYDIPDNCLIATLNTYSPSKVFDMSFSPCGGVLAVGDENGVALFDTRIPQTTDKNQVLEPAKTYPTKCTAVHGITFRKLNLVLAAGVMIDA